MNSKGFVASALLYGILSLFLVLILGTLSIVSERRLASDRLKESALNDVENLKTDESCFTINGNCKITGYDSTCGRTVFIDKYNVGSCELMGIEDYSFSDISNGYVYIKSDIDISPNAFFGNSNVTFVTIGIRPSVSTEDGEIWGASNSYLKAY